MNERTRDERQAAVTPAESVAKEPVVGVSVPVEQLSPEEQMALFEAKLKEEDWGHQPC